MVQRLTQRLAVFGVLKEVFDYRLTVADRTNVLEWKRHPSVQHTSAHRCDRAVDDIVEGGTVIGLPVREFEVTNRETVEPHVFVFLDTAQVLDMSRLQVLRHVEVHQDSSCRGHTCRHFFQTESLERTHTP